MSEPAKFRTQETTIWREGPLPILPEPTYYKVIYADGIPELVCLVNTLVEQGYRPLGGVATSMEGLQTLYIQAITLTDAASNQHSQKG